MDGEQDEYLSEKGKESLKELLEASGRVQNTDHQMNRLVTSKLSLRNKKELLSFFGMKIGQEIYEHFLRHDLNVDWDTGIENHCGDMCFHASKEVEFKNKFWEVKKIYLAPAELLEKCRGCDDVRIWENPRNWSYEVNLMI